ncbi:MAG TPA: pyridoxamine 5'-phosphate oxidase family protein [Candidatus Limnocylindria bacterium]|jgi:hypothetical protein|nr:pyridoxamine 5'-phosphate oxidase family protein [Candidatus Limnocylindria bacterium]
MKTKATVKKTSPTKTASKKVVPRKATTPKTQEPTHKNLDIYGAKPIPWSRALKQLGASAGGTYWLATTKPDGRPHVAAVGALWVDGKIYFVSGTRTRKSRNLAANPSCVVSVSLTGIYLVFEGTAIRVADRPTLLRLASPYAAQGWPEGEWRGLHGGVQRAQRRSAPVESLRGQAQHGGRRRHSRSPGATRWRFESAR